MQNMVTRRAMVIGLGTAALLHPDASGAASQRRVPFGFRPAAPLVEVGADSRVSGLEYEIIAAAMRVPGHEIISYFGPNARLVQALYRAAVDAIAPAVSLEGTQFTLSEPYLVYHNVAITLADRQLSIASMADLAGLRVNAFQRARKALGALFANAVSSFAAYHEEGHQDRQALPLVHDRTDVIIGDRRILLHHLRMAMAAMGVWKEWKVHPLFTPTPRSAAFREASIAADFNAGLAAIRADGTYQALMDQYSTPD
ncbi:substrate-binding periplasmic protein [Indioceanicola profundi]|uniref:substrate-binding periplasmic protein n=1 Tax=Indioceanicola profundi TaxID=2220096 RepID=UPI000E6AE204|nr:transporter substrate-binding domain-containing protein [Indioceanicola profundi]